MAPRHLAASSYASTLSQEGLPVPSPSILAFSLGLCSYPLSACGSSESSYFNWFLLATTQVACSLQPHFLNFSRQSGSCSLCAPSSVPSAEGHPRLPTLRVLSSFPAEATSEDPLLLVLPPPGAHPRSCLPTLPVAPLAQASLWHQLLKLLSDCPTISRHFLSSAS